MLVYFFTDLDIANGMDRSMFEKVIESMMIRLDFDPSIGNLVIDEYTCWTNVTDPMENRNQFLQASRFIQCRPN